MSGFPKKTRDVITQVLTEYGELGTRDLFEKVKIRGPFSLSTEKISRAKFAEIVRQVPGIKVRHEPDTGNFWSISQEPVKKPDFNKDDQPIADAIIKFLNSQNRRYTAGKITEHIAALGYKLPDKTQALYISNIMRRLVLLGLVVEDACVKAKHGSFVKTYRRNK